MGAQPSCTSALLGAGRAHRQPVGGALQPSRAASKLRLGLPMSHTYVQWFFRCRMASVRVAVASVTSGAVLLAGCASSSDRPEESSASITRGTPATFSWVASAHHIDPTGIDSYSCTATLIAPRVVLTAAHCVPKNGAVGDGDFVKFDLLQDAPKRNAAAFARFRDGNGIHTGSDDEGYINRDQHDVGLWILAARLDLDRYPSRARSSEVGKRAFGVGQISHGDGPFRASVPDDLENENARYYRVRDGFFTGYGEPGDSGGPWVINGTERIAGVHSSNELVARVDPLACWIANKVAAFGGEGPQAEFGGRSPSVSDYCTK
jgi:hypothetical protein